jgi:hypothetical protein
MRMFTALENCCRIELAESEDDALAKLRSRSISRTDSEGSKRVSQ